MTGEGAIWKRGCSGARCRKLQGYQVENEDKKGRQRDNIGYYQREGVVERKAKGRKIQNSVLPTEMNGDGTTDNLAPTQVPYSYPSN